MSTDTRSAVGVADASSTKSSAGYVTSVRYIAPTSRAIPATDRQSGRFGVTSRSSTVSESCAYSENSMPMGASSGRIIIPSWSLPSPNSRAEQFIPMLVTPRSFDFLILKSPGNSAPTIAQTIWSPSLKFCAPHTICSGSGLPSVPRLCAPTSTAVTHK